MGCMLAKGSNKDDSTHLCALLCVLSLTKSAPEPAWTKGRKEARGSQNAWGRGLISHTVALLLGSSRACQASQVRFATATAGLAGSAWAHWHTHTHSYRHMHIHTLTRTHTHTLRKLCLVLRLHFTVDGLLGRALWFGQALQLHVRVGVSLLSCFVGLGACMYV